MAAETPFEDVPPVPATDQLLLDLDGYAGPIDVLLELAREQKVDLVHISILELADQYLVFVTRARRLSLELAADYLVMAAWLAYLKSRLLLPRSEGDEAEPTGAEMAAALRFQLQRLEAMREAAARLMARPQLGVDIFLRGMPEGVRVIARADYDVSLYELLRAYADHRRRTRGEALAIAPVELYTVDEALQRLSDLLGRMPDWQTLRSFLPAEFGTGVLARSALAATLAASLELARAGELEMRQTESFGPIYVRRRRPPA